MNWSGLLGSVSADKAVGPAVNIADERPGSGNRNLPGVKYPLELAGELAAGANLSSVICCCHIYRRIVGAQIRGRMASAERTNLGRRCVSRVLGAGG